MVKVRLKGLKIAHARGKYYVYVRATGKALITGFEGTKAQLIKKLEDPDMIGAYNARRGARTYPAQTLGWLVAWYQSDDCAEYQALAKSTRENYDAALLYLEPEYDAPLDTITPAAVYGVRDKCAVAKWPAFADNVTTTLSSMFNAAVKRGKMPSNPAIRFNHATCFVWLLSASDRRTRIDTMTIDGKTQLEFAIQALGLSQERAGDWLGIGRRTSQGYALGEYPVPEPVAKLLRLCVKMKLDPEDVK